MQSARTGYLCIIPDLTEEYREIGVPAVRLHDTDWPYPPCVDVYQIFRDFSKDENDPTNYDFVLTDQYLAVIRASGAEIVYRIGTSIEHIKNRRFVYAPKDNAKWAWVAEKIIRYYNEGWADGYHYGIRFWEIWNLRNKNHVTPHGASKGMDINICARKYIISRQTYQSVKKVRFTPGFFAFLMLSYLDIYRLDVVRNSTLQLQSRYVR